MKKATSKPLSSAQKAELAALAALPDDKINTRAVPEQLNWSGARRGVFYRPVKRQLTLRLDADVVAWFKSRAPNGSGYQTSINNALREYVARHTQG
ncbi:MAG TPA: BrnA antitoxin family protein [Acetobacteraceae bacterium]|nr:BrnA antitoxin family protein [Acetobacteraceae bacterium]